MQNLADIAAFIAAAAGIIVILITLRQVYLAQQTRYDSRRPVLFPSNFALDTRPSDAPVSLAIRNVGAGPATNVRGVILVWYARTDPAFGGFTHLKAVVHEPIAEAEEKPNVTATQNEATHLTPETHIGKMSLIRYVISWLAAILFGTRKPTRQGVSLAIPRYGDVGVPETAVIWRVTLSYHDLFGRKHASVFDFADGKTMARAVGFFEGISKDLDDLEQQA